MARSVGGALTWVKQRLAVAVDNVSHHTRPSPICPNRNATQPAEKSSRADNAAMNHLDRLLSGISTYQDVVIDGRTIRRGRRDCEQRWQAIAPHLPQTGVLLDVGANFGWFCQRWCNEGPERIAVAWEADLRSAAVARYVLAANMERRVALCTAPARADTARRIVASGRRIDAVLCLSVLHWMPDHRPFLTELGKIADRILIEQPRADESNAGIAEVRQAIGAIGPYLRQLFPDRPVQQVASWPSHLDGDSQRELWLVGPANEVPPASPAAIDPALLRDLDLAWPPRSWWQSQLPFEDGSTSAGLAFTPLGVQACADFRSRSSAEWRRLVAQLPERRTTTWRRKVRRIFVSAWRRARSGVFAGEDNR